MLRDSDRLRYNRDEREVRQLQVGRGLSRKQTQNGEGIKDVFNAIGKAGKWVSDNQKTIGDVTKTVGNIVKTGIQVGKEVEDLKRVQALKKATEDSLRKREEALRKPEEVDRIADTAQVDDSIFNKLRLQAEEIKKGKGTKKNGKGLYLS